MDASLGHALVRLRKGEARRLPGGRGRGVAVFEGQIWLTQDGDPRDTILESGESFGFDRDGDVVVQAFAPSALLLYSDGTDLAPVPARDRAGPRISAYELARVTRQMRHAAIARMGVRAAGAVVYAVERARLALLRALRQAGARRAAVAARATRHWHGAADGACA